MKPKLKGQDFVKTVKNNSDIIIILEVTYLLTVLLKSKLPPLLSHLARQESRVKCGKVHTVKNEVRMIFKLKVVASIGHLIITLFRHSLFMAFPRAFRAESTHKSIDAQQTQL